MELRGWIRGGTQQLEKVQFHSQNWCLLGDRGAGATALGVWAGSSCLPSETAKEAFSRETPPKSGSERQSAGTSQVGTPPTGPSINLPTTHLLYPGLVHAGGTAGGEPPGEGFGRGLGAAIRVSALLIPHGFDVAAAAHAPARDGPLGRGVRLARGQQRGAPLASAGHLGAG